MAALHDQMIDLPRKLRTQKAHNVHQRLLAVATIVPDVRMAKETAQCLVFVHQFVETVECEAETLPDHSHHDSPPHLHARRPNVLSMPGRVSSSRRANNRERKCSWAERC